MTIEIDHDLRPHLCDVRDQLDRPTCLAFALSDTHTACRPGTTPLSCEYLYYQAIKKDGRQPSEAITVKSALFAIKDDGQPVENDWPYITKTPIDPSSWSPPNGISTVHKHTGHTESVAFAHARDLVLNDYPTVVGITLTNQFHNPKNGVIDDAAEPLDPNRRHAVIAVGAGHRGKKNFLLIRNSWGSHWGLKGYAWLSEAYMTPRLIAVLKLSKVA